ncbi:chitin elicitor receptor kinase 1-like [Miscanthus floridulus]|uniref:chitin elicitor receptor kinase 1-like n=1 Tax=Miscanthus floridulus TaxID=154761 RepID=UPI00345A40E6
MAASQMHKVDGSIEFSYEELYDVTNNFSMEHKIGQGGFGSVYAGLIGEKAAIKKMDTKSSQEFLAELKVLTHIHHSNLQVTGSGGGAAVSKPGWGREAIGLPRLRTLMLSFCFDTIGTMGFSISFHCYHEQANLIIDSHVPILMTQTVMCPF